MHERELKAIVDHLLAVAARMDQHDGQLEQQVPATIEEQTARWLRTVAGKAETAAWEGLQPTLIACQLSVQNLATEIDTAVTVLQGAQRGLASITRWVMIGMAVTLLFSLIALIGTYAMLYGHYQTRYNALAAQVTYLDTVNRADVVPCGDGQLCARIDDKAPRYGDKKQYRVVEPRGQ